MITIFLDSDGTHDMGHYVLVYGKTGVRYETQCGGTLTATRGGEGFLVSVGPESAGRSLIRFVARHPDDTPWSPQKIEELAAVVGKVEIWTHHAGDVPHALELDETRMHDCLEALGSRSNPARTGLVPRTQQRLTRAQDLRSAQRPGAAGAKRAR